MALWNSNDSLTPSTLNRKFSSGLSSAMTVGWGLFNVKDYGAVGDGSSDDTTAIQNAITAAQSGITSARTYSPVVFVPPGHYKISDTLVVAAQIPVNLIGVGQQSLISWGGASGNTSMVRYAAGSGSTAQTFGVCVEKLQFTTRATSPSGLIALTLGTAGGVMGDFTVRNCAFINVESSVVCNNEADGFNFEDNYFKYFTTGVLLQSDGTSSLTRYKFSCNFFDQGSGWAVDAQRGSALYFANNMVQSAEATAAKGGVRVDNNFAVTLVGNYFEWAAPGQQAILVNPTALGTQGMGSGSLFGNAFVLSSVTTGVTLAYVDGWAIGPNDWTGPKTAIELTVNAKAVTVAAQNMTGVTTRLSDVRTSSGGTQSSGGTAFVGPLTIQGSGGAVGAVPLTVSTLTVLTTGTVAGRIDGGAGSIDLTVTGPTYSPSGVYVADGVVFVSTGLSGGLNFFTSNAGPIAFYAGTGDGTLQMQVPPLGGSQVTAGTTLIPGLAIISEASLGLYRSAASTLAQSYGTFSAPGILASVIASSSTTAQSGATAKLGQGQLYFSVLSLTSNGGEFGFRSGNTVYRFSSDAVG